MWEHWSSWSAAALLYHEHVGMLLLHEYLLLRVRLHLAAAKRKKAEADFQHEAELDSLEDALESDE